MRTTIQYDQGKAGEALEREKLLSKEKIEYCLRHWMDDSPNHRNSPERRVKEYLDDVAYLLLRDDPGDTLTRYKILSQGSREIDVSSCPAEISDSIYGARCAPAEDEHEVYELLLEKMVEKLSPYKKEKAPKKRPLTRFEKIEAVKNELSGCKFTFCEIDTENIFEYGGVEYQIGDAVTQYQPKKTKEGLLYDMDRVTVVETANGMLRFYDQSIERIADEDVTLIDP